MGESGRRRRARRRRTLNEDAPAQPRVGRPGWALQEVTGPFSGGSTPQISGGRAGVEDPLDGTISAAPFQVEPVDQAVAPENRTRANVPSAYRGRGDDELRAVVERDGVEDGPVGVEEIRISR